ncbi:ribonuclease H1-like [Microcaecilia unicolor]|uniref:ribonuclease H n=1 Tax=Microcaecilia unicolor TaxID=1415580 RepID=A0A6P7Y5B9_9AMPH|nr:ribonuclease H1-like [Microcaecilia unicolor]
MPKVYVDGCAYRRDTDHELVAGVGVVWNPTVPEETLKHSLGSQTNQYAEIAAALVAVQSAVQKGIRELVICTDSDYVRQNFVSHLPNWKQNNMLNSKGKPVHHGSLILALDRLVWDHDMTIYWKKVKGHAKVDSPDKIGNDLADQLAKEGALTGEPWRFSEPETLAVHAVT